MQLKCTCDCCGRSPADIRWPAGLSIARPRVGTPLAFVFHDHPADIEAPNLLRLIELDPHRAGHFDDARLDQTIEVGAARVEGHGGHHSIDFDASGRRAIVSNPGAGTLALFPLLSLGERQVLGEFPVGGVPTKVIVVGSRGPAH